MAYSFDNLKLINIIPDKSKKKIGDRPGKDNSPKMPVPDTVENIFNLKWLKFETLTSGLT